MSPTIDDPEIHCSDCGIPEALHPECHEIAVRMAHDCDAISADSSARLLFATGPWKELIDGLTGALAGMPALRSSFIHWDGSCLKWGDSFLRDRLPGDAVLVREVLADLAPLFQESLALRASRAQIIEDLADAIPLYNIPF